VDRAFQKVLRRYDFMASFKRTATGESRLRLVKVYPRGDRRGSLARIRARGGPAAGGPESPSGNATVPGGWSIGRTGVPGSVLAGGHPGLLAIPAAAEGEEEAGERFPMTTVLDVGVAFDLAEQEMLHEEWRLSRKVMVAGEPEQHAVLLAATASERRMVAAQREGLLAGLQREQYLQDAGMGDSFALSLPR